MMEEKQSTGGQDIEETVIPQIINTQPSILSISSKRSKTVTIKENEPDPVSVPSSQDPLKLLFEEASTTDILSQRRYDPKNNKISSTDFLSSRRLKYGKKTLDEDTSTDDVAGERNFRHAKHKLKQYKEQEEQNEDKFQEIQDPSIRWCKKNLKVILTVFGVLIGLCVGLLVGPTRPSELVIRFIFFPGELFLRMMSLLSLPLIAACIISDVSSLYIGALGKMGRYVISFYIITTIFGVIVGTLLAVVIKPGIDQDNNTEEHHIKNYTATDAIFDLLRNIVPDNLIKVGLERTHLDVAPPRSAEKHSSHDGVNLLGVITCCFAFGFVLRELKERAQIMIDFFAVLEEVALRLFNIIMWFSPLGIASLVAYHFIMNKDFFLIGKQFGLYLITVTLGLGTHLFVTLFAIYFAFTQTNPFIFFKGMFPAWVNAMATSSSNGTLPKTLRCLDKNLGVNRRITRFVMPIGLIMNKDGTALSVAVAATFITQMNNKPLEVDTVLTIGLTSIFVSIGTGGLPGSAMIALVPVLQSLDLPLTDLTLVLAIDWLVDRMRTSVNIFGDAVAVGIANHFNAKRFNVVVVDIERCVEKAKANASKLDIGGYPKKLSTFSLLLYDLPDASADIPTRRVSTLSTLLYKNSPNLDPNRQPTWSAE